MGKYQITYPRTFEKYRWYKPVITAILTAIIYLALCYISAQVAIFAIGMQTITNMFTVNLTSTSIASLSLYYFMGLLLPALYIANRIVRDRPFSSYCSSRAAGIGCFSSNVRPSHLRHMQSSHS